MTVVEDLTSQVDGVAVVFTVSTPYEAGTLLVIQQGTGLRPVVEYAETTSTTFTMAVPPENPAGEPADALVVSYDDGISLGSLGMEAHTSWPVPSP